MNWEHRGNSEPIPALRPAIAISIPKASIDLAVDRGCCRAAAFGGVIWFAYQNGRDANRSGPPPLVKADSGPVKVKPDNPGGRRSRFRDSTVYDRLNQNGQKPVVEKLLPPTEEPVARPQPEQWTLRRPMRLLRLRRHPAGGRYRGRCCSPPAKQVAAKPTLVTQPVTITPAPQITGGVQVTDTASPTALAPTPGSIITQPAAAPASRRLQCKRKPVPPKTRRRRALRH